MQSASATRSESSRAANCAASCASQPFQFCATKGKVRLKFIGKCDCHYYDETANVIIRWLVTTVRPLLRCRDEDSSGFFAIVSQKSHQKSTEPVLHSYFMCRQLGDQLKKKDARARKQLYILLVNDAEEKFVACFRRGKLLFIASYAACAMSYAASIH